MQSSPAIGPGVTLTARTGESGFYTLELIPAGKYVVSALLPGAIQGSLLNSQGRPAAGVRVEVLRLNARGNPNYYAEKKR